jgi:beta-glucosidase-like glycosyl hydrolase
MMLTIWNGKVSLLLSWLTCLSSLSYSSSSAVLTMAVNMIEKRTKNKDNQDINLHGHPEFDAVDYWYQVCTQDNVRSLPFCDVALELEERVADYVERVVPVSSQINMMGNTAHPYPPLHIPTYQWWSEGLHGALMSCVDYQNSSYCPTSFPCPSGLGNAFNTTLYGLLGRVIGTEVRAISDYKRSSVMNASSAIIGNGLTIWSPTINLQRDPRWGRNQEGMYVGGYVV